MGEFIVLNDDSDVVGSGSTFESAINEAFAEDGAKSQGYGVFSLIGKISLGVSLNWEDQPVVAPSEPAKVKVLPVRKGRSVVIYRGGKFEKFHYFGPLGNQNPSACALKYLANKRGAIERRSENVDSKDFCKKCAEQTAARGLQFTDKVS